MTEQRVRRTAASEDDGTTHGGPEELRFHSGDADRTATLYRPRPATAGDVPCVVMSTVSTRREGFPRFAERFVEAGFAALTFDPRHLCDSGREPPQLVDIARERDDVAAAVASARTLGGVDAGPVAVWGFSLGGGLALCTAAADERIVATVELCPWVDGSAFQLGGARYNVRRLAAATGALLVGLGTHDTIVPVRPIERGVDRARRAELRRYAIGHFDGFLDAFQDVVEGQVAFLARHLVPSPTG